MLSREGEGARRLIGGAILAALAALLLIPVQAGATWPGTNGKIFFNCREIGVLSSGMDICSINPDGSELLNLTDSPDSQEGGPQVSKTGNQVTYTSNASGVTTVWAMNSDGSNQRQVSELAATGPSWTPGGQISFRAALEGGTFEFRVVPASGGPSTLLAPASGSDSPPRFTTGGSWLYTSFAPVEVDSGTFTTQVFVVDGEVENQVTASSPALSSNSFPSWSPDGQSILYNRTDSTPGFGNDDDIYMVPRNGGPEVQLTNTPGPVDERWASLSPDGTKLIYHGEDADNDFFSQFLSIADSDGSNPVPIDTPTLVSATFPDWATVGSEEPELRAGFTATAPKSSRATRPIKVTLRCIGDTRCAVSYRALLAVPRSGKPARRFTIRAKNVTLQPKAVKVVQLAVPASAKGMVAQAIRSRKSPVLTVTAAATQPDGPKIRTVKLRVKLTK